MSDAPKTALEHFNSAAANYEASTGGCTRDLAQYILSIAPPITLDSVILDNACGTGIVAQEILSQFKHGNATLKQPPTIQCVDAAPAMVDLARSALQQYSNAENAAYVRFGDMPGEKLEFEDDYFTHSITNLGILFFADGQKGAREIYRTLRPGGTAIVTSWAELGYVPVIHAAQRGIQRADKLFEVPIEPEWYVPKHLEDVLKESGFGNVEIHEKEVFYGAGSVGEVCGLLLGALLPIWLKDWDDAGKEEFKVELRKVAEGAVRRFERNGVGECVGIPMRAIVAVAKK